LSDVANVMAGYDRWPAVYDTDQNPMQALEGLAVREMLGNVAGLKVLDLGCGTGRHALRQAENDAVVTAFETSQRECCQKLAVSLELTWWTFYHMTSAKLFRLQKVNSIWS